MSKMVKLLTLVAVVAVLVMPAIARAQEAAPYKLGDEIKTWTVKKTFTIDEKDFTATFTLKRTVTEDPAMKYYLKEAKEFYTWKEGVAVSGPTDPFDMGYYTIRTGTTPAAPKPKIYKATPPSEVKSGWKKGLEPVR